ncbi:hypothetical protein RRG08_045745 [Elysia crispata]|uniref:PiggyBac transposable element-derived protein domain-containing protein n=1 Tax=Elysia crispata TaxID=231223 RepID=A0AAE0Z8X6_9GAST|nr:hypothetical protein RRG08_045745 [Elysia crispata]
MAFEFLQSLQIEHNLDGNDESDIELGEMSEGEEDSTPNSATPLPSLDLDLDQDEEWTDELVDFADRLEPFTEFSGPVHDLPVDSGPLDYFKLFFPDSVLNMIVEETNRYAEQQQEAKGAEDVYWKPATLADIRKYIYTLITFGHHQVPELSLIWSSDPYWRVPAIADIWGRQRYQKIHQYFHLADSSHQPGRNDEGYDPLYKVRPLLDHIRNVCSSVYKPKQNLSVDEAMVAFTGRVSFKQYIKNKPTPWGFKVWCLAEAETGYLLNFQVYTGKTATQPEHGLGHQVVTSMMANHLEKNHAVHFDNFFTSVKLAEDLLKEKTTCCGTIRTNRKGWPLPSSKQKPGEVRMRQKGRMVAVQWTDKRQVNILSTNADPKMVTVERRTKAGVVQVQVPKPVVQYNKAMFGVDLNDQNRSYYPVGRPGTKWWRYLFNYLVQISIINAFILMKRARPDDSRTSASQNHLVFRTHLVKALVAVTEPDQPARRAPDVPSLQGSSSPYSPSHSLGKMPGRKRRCFQCAQDGVKMASGRTRETTSGCHLCNVHLHAGECYAKFHSSLKN